MLKEITLGILSELGYKFTYKLGVYSINDNIKVVISDESKDIHIWYLNNKFNDKRNGIQMIIDCSDGWRGIESHQYIKGKLEDVFSLINKFES